MVKKSVSVNWDVPCWALKVPPIHSAPLIEYTFPSASSRTTPWGTMVTVKFSFPDTLAPSCVAVLDLAAEEEEWSAEQEKVVEEAREAYRDTIKAMAEARAELGEAIGFANWIRRFRQKPMAGPSATPKMFRIGNGPDDRALGHDELVALLLADADPPVAPSQASSHTALGAQVWPANGVSVGRSDG